MNALLAGGAARTSADVECSHCGLPVPPGLVEAEASHQFCCGGCRTVYETIHGSGLQAYYAIVEDESGEARRARTTGRGFEEFDHEEFMEHHVLQREDGTRSIRLYLEGVHCAACVWLLEKLPNVLDGVLDARLDFGRSVLEVRWDPQRLNLSSLARALDRLGYPAHPWRARSDEDRRRSEDRASLVRIAVAGALGMNVMGIAFALYGGYLSGIEDHFRNFFRWTSLALTTVVLLWPGRVFFRGAWAALRTRTPHMDLPIAIGIGAGYLGGAWNTISGVGETYFESVAVLVFLLLLGRYAQQRQQRRAWDAIELLSALTPARARRLRSDGELEEVPVDALTAGDRISLRAGETVPADGLLQSAAARFDLSVLTGESQPVEVEEGGRVHAGTVNLGGQVEVLVDAVGGETRIGRLMQLVERYASRPARMVQLADRISGWFTLVVLALAALTFTWWAQTDVAAALENAVALLIVACPCALGLATPLAIVAAVGRAARVGILVKGGDALERLARPGLLLLDKTGTLTEGQVDLVHWQEVGLAPSDVQGIVRSESALGTRVAALEEHASHPFAVALREHFAPSTSAAQVADVALLPGLGIRGQVDGRELLIGSPAAAEQAGAAVPPASLEPILALGASPIAVVEDGKLVAIAGFGDPLLPDARSSLDALRARGWRPAILSGDHPAIVQSVGLALGIAAEDCHGGLTPEQKVAAVEAAAADGAVTMVGDGWNDAAALAAADTGLAVHGGAEASLAAADAYLVHPGLGGIVALSDGAARTARIVRINLWVSLAYNATGVALAMGGLLNPLVAAVLMPVSSLSVVAVAWRSRSFDEA